MARQDFVVCAVSVLFKVIINCFYKALYGCTGLT